MRRFRIRFDNFPDLAVPVYKEPSETAEPQMVDIGTFQSCVVLPSQAESEDWVFVTLLDHERPIGDRWIPASALGEMVPSDAPAEVSAASLALGAMRNELRMQEAGEGAVSAEYLLALFFLTNGHGGYDGGFPAEESFAIVRDRPGGAEGAFAITQETWNAFMADDGAETGWTGVAVASQPIPQMRAAAWKTLADWNAIAQTLAPDAPEDFVVRRVDNFMAWVAGAEVAAEIVRRERDGETLDVPVTDLLGAAGDRARQLWPQFLDDGAEPATAAAFRERAEAELDGALALGRKALDAYVPGFAAQPATDASTWIKAAQDELRDWQQGGWTEQSGEGRKRALSYFEATPETNPQDDPEGQGEITHWCGAFLAWVMDQAGVTPPKEAAASKSWASWGDASYPVAWGSDVPQGAVAVMAGSDLKIGHVALFMGWADEGRFRALGGNQSDKVTLDERAKVSRLVALRVLADRSAHSGEDLDVLARTLWGEIRSGNPQQRRNVADVILNRFLDGYRSRGTIASVCLAPSQFSCWNSGTSARREIDALPKDDPVLAELRTLALGAIRSRLTGQAPADARLTGARHYHTPQVSPPWSHGRVSVLNDGAHLFFRDIA